MASPAKIFQPGVRKRVIKQECLCTEEVINPRKAIENRKALQEQYDTALKTCPLKQQNRKKPARKCSPPSTRFVMNRPPDPPPPSNNSCSPNFSTPVQELLGCSSTSPCRSPTCPRPESSCRSPAASSQFDHSSESLQPSKCASPKFVTQACSESPSAPCSPPPQTSRSCSSKTPEKPKSCTPDPTKGSCDPNSQESICAKRKAERMRRFAIGFAIGSLLLLLLYWNFKKTILKSLGISDGSEDDDSDGIMGGGFDAMSIYRRNLLGKRGQTCWFNWPCQYDYEEDEWIVSEIQEPVRRHDKLHL